MPQGDKSTHADKQKSRAGAAEKGSAQKGAGRPEAGARGWASANKLQGGGKNMGQVRKVPFGPVGGSGRKTNLSRSS